MAPAAIPSSLDVRKRRGMAVRSGAINGSVVVAG
jgi:hypothetical protein